MIDILRPHPGPRPRVALLDFDGTLSLVRSGWQRLMATMMIEALVHTPRCEDRPALERRVSDCIDELTGRPTIEQMEWLCLEIARRGGQPDRPQAYKQQYLLLLQTAIDERLLALRRGTPRAQFLVPGAVDFLETITRAGMLPVLASGTDRAGVLREASALGIAGFFGPHIYAPEPGEAGFSKRAVIDRVLAEIGAPGAVLIAFGDGPVEIAETRAAGGYAVGVALDEERGGVDQHKHDRLVRAGADAIVVDLREPERLLAQLGILAS